MSPRYHPLLTAHVCVRVATLLVQFTSGHVPLHRVHSDADLTRDWSTVAESYVLRKPVNHATDRLADVKGIEQRKEDAIYDVGGAACERVGDAEAMVIVSGEQLLNAKSKCLNLFGWNASMHKTLLSPKPLGVLYHTYNMENISLAILK